MHAIILVINFKNLLHVPCM